MSSYKKLKAPIAAHLLKNFAVKNIQKLDDSKRKILLDQISAKLFQVLLVTNHWTKLISHSEQSNHGLKIVLGTRR